MKPIKIPADRTVHDLDEESAIGLDMILRGDAYVRCTADEAKAAGIGAIAEYLEAKKPR